MIMESRSGETSHLQRTWGSGSLLVNVRLRVRTAKFYSLLLNDVLYAFDQIS